MPIAYFYKRLWHRAYSNVQNYQQAQVIFELLIKNDPQRTSLYPELATVAIQNKNLPLANQTIDTAI
jgi:hypothetical protein